MKTRWRRQHKYWSYESCHHLVGCVPHSQGYFSSPPSLPWLWVPPNLLSN